MANDKIEVTKVASISIKTAGYSAKDIRNLVSGSATKGETHFLARVGGVVVESFGGESKNGHWDGFKGIFTLINKDGKAFSSTTIFLPLNITKGLMEKLSHGRVEVSFMADIFVVESDKVASGYGYICESVASEEAEKIASTIADRVIGGKLPTTLKLAAPKKKIA
jgi:hypothetical protein